MLLSPFQHHRPKTLEAAHELHERFIDDSAFYAGGTEILLALKARVLKYAHLIDLKALPNLDRIERDGDALVVGPLVTHFRLATDPEVLSSIPSYAIMSDGIANIRVRVAGTLAGNLCFAEPHADPPTLLSAMGASVTLCSASGERTVPVSEFVIGPFTTSRNDDEILTSIRIPTTAYGERFSYRSFGHLEYPAVGVAAGCLRKNESTLYRIWVGCIGDNPINAEAVELALEGVPPESLKDVLEESAQGFASSLAATDDIYGSADYKRHLAAVLMRRAINNCAGLPEDTP